MDINAQGKQRYLSYCERHGIQPQPWETLQESFREQWYPQVPRKPAGAATQPDAQQEQAC